MSKEKPSNQHISMKTMNYACPPPVEYRVGQYAQAYLAVAKYQQKLFFFERDVVEKKISDPAILAQLSHEQTRYSTIKNQLDEKTDMAFPADRLYTYR